jgi:hypothetical protein
MEHLLLDGERAARDLSDAHQHAESVQPGERRAVSSQAP